MRWSTASWSKSAALVLAALQMAPAAVLASAVTHRGWRQDVDAALKEARGKPVALFFSAEWCHFCHAMLDEADRSKEVAAALADVRGILVDVDENPEIASQMGLRGVPALVVLDTAGRVAARHEGYMSGRDLAAALNRARAPAAKGAETLELWPEADVETVETSQGAAGLVRLLGQGAPRRRMLVREKLAARTDADEELFRALASPRLGVRIDASAVLAKRHGPHPAYDPMGPEAERAVAAEAWRRSVAEPERPRGR